MSNRVVAVSKKERLMRLLFYSDLHLRQDRLEDCDTALIQIGELAKKHNAIVVNGGDTFNTRGIIPTECLDLLHFHYKSWAENRIEQVILVGNHDQQDKEGRIHPMKVFSSFPGWAVVDGVYIHPYLPVAFFNYMPRENILPAITDAVEKLSGMFTEFYAVVHWGISGAHMNDSFKDSDGVPLEWLKDFKMVFSGHYHLRDSFANVQYIGSPFQQNFGEKDQTKGVLLLDGDELQFIPIEGTRRHYEITADKDFHFDSTLNGRDFLKVKAYGNDKIDKEVFEKLGTKNIMVERIAKEVDQNRMDISGKDVGNINSLMEKFVEFKDTELSKEKLIGIGKKLFGGH